MLQNSKPSCCSASRASSGETWQQPHFEKGNDKDAEMIRLSGGTFLMGTEDKEGFPADGEGPVKEMTLSDFEIAPATVTNNEFKKFIDTTHYVTDADRYGWSFVFYGLLSEKARAAHPRVAVQTPWWAAIEGACWNRPEGPDSNISQRMDHPVVQVSWNDAQAYCRWAGLRLPTEAEWEYAARGGLVQKKYPWGDELTPGGKHQCNIWQGIFPQYNSLKDGFLGTAPARSFSPNGYGLYNVSGNVWEWCADWFSPDFRRRDTSINPRGPEEGQSRVMRGGSFLCHHSYCNRYRVAARSANTPDSGSSNMGFRCCR